MLNFTSQSILGIFHIFGYRFRSSIGRVLSSSGGLETFLIHIRRHIHKTLALSLYYRYTIMACTCIIIIYMYMYIHVYEGVVRLL